MDISTIVNIVLCILSFLLAAISVVTVIITLMQNSKMIEGSTRPYISMYIGTTYFSSTTTYLVMKNYGSSSAFITSFMCSVDLSSCAYDKAHIPFSHIVGYSLCPGETLSYPIQVSNLPENPEPIKIHIDYQTTAKKYSEDLTLNLSAQFDMLHIRSSTKNQELKVISYALQDIAEKML